MLVQGKLHSDMCDPKQARKQAAVKGFDAFRPIYRKSRVEGVAIPHLISGLGLIQRSEQNGEGFTYMITAP